METREGVVEAFTQTDARDCSPFEFPPELEREIFTIAFHEDPDDVLNLLLVSKAIFDWIIPLCYEVIVHDGDRKWPAVLQYDQLEKYGHYVRHMHSDDLAPLIPSCPNIFNLATWVTVNVQSLLELPITRLSIDMATFSPPTPDMFPFCARITHLDVSNKANWNPTEILPHFVALTHISMFSNEQESIIRKVMDVGKNLRVIILLFRDWSKGIEPLTEADRTPEGRYVDDHVVHVGFRRRFITDWEEGARGGEDMWAFADKVVKERQTKKA